MFVGSPTQRPSLGLSQKHLHTLSALAKSRLPSNCVINVVVGLRPYTRDLVYKIQERSLILVAPTSSWESNSKIARSFIYSFIHLNMLLSLPQSEVPGPTAPASLQTC